LNAKIKFEFKAIVWQYSSPKGGWYFVSLPSELSLEIRENLKWQEQGWGRLKATAKIRNTEWETAIWFDTKLKTYLLPLKADVRKVTKLDSGDEVEIISWL